MSKPSVADSIVTVITLDVGATGVQGGYGGWTAREEVQVDEPTPESTDAFVSLVRTVIADLRAEARNADRQVEAVAVGLPGTLTADGRLDTSLHTSFAGLDLEAALAGDVDCPLVLANDTNAQALGCASPEETLCYVALGTGVGGAVVDGGRLFEGARGFAGEVGHVRVTTSDRQCVCGKRGCLYTAAAGTALVEDLGDAWWDRDRTPSDRARIEDAGRAVGEAATTVAAVIDPDRVVVAGQLTGQAPFRSGLTGAVSHPFSACPVETVRGTWPLARDGLARLVETGGRRPGAAVSDREV